jgi:hypothetical protein
MAYFCTRCEAEEHPNMPKERVRNEFEQDRNLSVTTYCATCSSNTVHISDSAKRLSEMT